MLIWEDLSDVILVGHSFAGLVISAVADELPTHIRHLVYLDAFIPENGQSAFDTLAPELVKRLRDAAQQTGALPAPRPTSLGLTQDEDIAFVASRLTPHPIGSYETAFTLQHPIGNGLPATYLACTQPLFTSMERSHQWVRKNAPHWNWRELTTGHDAMVSAPALVLDALSGL